MDSKARQLMERFAVVHGANDRDAPKSYMVKMGVGVKPNPINSHKVRLTTGRPGRDAPLASSPALPATPSPRRSSAPAAGRRSEPTPTYWRTRAATGSEERPRRRPARRRSGTPQSYWRTRGTPPPAVAAAAPPPSVGAVADLARRSSLFAEACRLADEDVSFGAGTLDLSAPAERRATETLAERDIFDGRPSSVDWGAGTHSFSRPFRASDASMDDDDIDWGTGDLRMDDVATPRSPRRDFVDGAGFPEAASPSRPSRAPPPPPPGVADGGVVDGDVVFGAGTLDLGADVDDDAGVLSAREDEPPRRARRAPRSASEPPLPVQPSVAARPSPRRPWVSHWAGRRREREPPERLISSWRAWSAAFVGPGAPRRVRGATLLDPLGEVARVRASLRRVPRRDGDAPPESYEAARWGDPRLHSDDSSDNEADARWRGRRRSRGAPGWRFLARESPPPRRPPERRRSSTARVDAAGELSPREAPPPPDAAPREPAPARPRLAARPRPPPPPAAAAAPPPPPAVAAHPQLRRSWNSRAAASGFEARLVDGEVEVARYGDLANYVGAADAPVALGAADAPKADDPYDDPASYVR